MVERLDYAREYHDVENMTLCEPSLRMGFEKNNKNHKRYGEIFLQLNDAGLIQ